MVILNMMVSVLLQLYSGKLLSAKQHQLNMHMGHVYHKFVSTHQYNIILADLLVTSKAQHYHIYVRCASNLNVPYATKKITYSRKNHTIDNESDG